MKLFACLLAALATIAACAAHSPPSPAPDETFQTQVEPVWIDKSFSVFERAEIHRALDAWNYAMNGYYQFRVQDDKADPNDANTKEHAGTTGQGVIFYRTAFEEAEMMMLLGQLPPGVLAWTEPDRIGVHLIADRMGTRDLYTVIMHELGHTLALGHTRVPDTLMYVGFERQCSCVDRYTALNLASAHGWDWRRLR